MTIITATEFRKSQKKYFELAEKEPVFVTRIGKSPIALTRVELEDYPTAEELDLIQKGLNEFKKGKYTVIDTENIWESIL